jgi:capsular exopolysaccharide synthesis family protein
MNDSQYKIPADNDTGKAVSGDLVTLLDPGGIASEAYRALRTNLLYTQVDKPPKVILITSPGSKEGKSTACANLGVVLAQGGKDVLVMDCDFRGPTIHTVFGLPNTRGTVNVLAGECELQEACREPLPGLNVLSIGALPPNPAELLMSQRFPELLATARQRFDYVLLDSPPTKLFSDAAIVAAHSDAVLLAFNAQKTRKGDVKRAVHALQAVGANVLGTVMNKVKGSEEAPYY